MALIFRTSSLANTVPSYIKNAALTYEEGDGNFAYLLTNMSGSTITIEGATTVTGSLEVIGPVTTFDGVGFWDPISLDFITIEAYDGKLILTGSLYGTASWATSASNALSASYAPIPTLQQVLNAGNEATSSLNVFASTTGSIYLHGELVGVPLNDIAIDPREGFIQLKSLYAPNTASLTPLGYSIANGTRTTSVVLQSPSTPGSNTVMLPQGVGTFAISVNGTGSNANGDIILTRIPTASLALTASYVPSLQQVTAVQNSTTLGLIVTDNIANSVSINPSFIVVYDDATGGYVQVNTNEVLFSNGSDSLSLISPFHTAGRTINLPNADGTVVVSVNTTASNSAGNVTITHIPTASFAISASWAPSTSTNTGSLLTTASVSSNTITFTKGDTSQFSVTINTGSATTVNTGSLLTTASVSLNTITFTKGDGSTFPITVDTGSSTVSAFPYTGSARITGSLGVTGSVSIAGDIESYDSTIFTRQRNSSNPVSINAENPTATKSSVIGYDDSLGPYIALYNQPYGGFILTGSFTDYRFYRMPDQSGELVVFPYTGSAQITGSLGVTGSVNITGSTYLRGLTSASQTSILTYDSTSGQVFFTASNAVGSTTATGSFLTTGSLSTTQQLSGSLNITGSLNFFSGSETPSKIENGWVVLSRVSASLDFANDTAAAAGGVPLGGLYRNGNTISIRIA